MASSQNRTKKTTSNTIKNGAAKSGTARRTAAAPVRTPETDTPDLPLKPPQKKDAPKSPAPPSKQAQTPAKKSGKKDRKTDRARERRVASGPSESWNVIMPYLLYAVAALLLLLYVIVFIGKIRSGSGDAGAVGDFLSNLCLWLTGVGSYVAPFALVVVAARWRGITAEGKTHGSLWVRFATVLVLTSAVIELLFGDHTLTWDAYGQALVNFSETSTILPGGFCGGLIALVMRWALKQVLSAIVLIAADLLVLMFFLGLTPEKIFHFMKERHIANRERRAEYLREVEEARKAEAAAAEAERQATEAAKAEEERLKKQNEAIERSRERERLRREEEDRKQQEELERLAREQEEADRKAQEEANRKEQEEADRKAQEEAERKAREEAERKAEEDKRKAEEEAKRRPPVDPEEQRRVIEESSRRNPPLPARNVGAPDFDFDSACEGTSPIPPSELPGDDELIPKDGRRPAPPAPPQNSEPAPGTDDADNLAEDPADENGTGADEGKNDPEPPAAPEPPPLPEYVYPPSYLLAEGKAMADEESYMEEVEAKKEELAATLSSFGIRFRKIEFSRGPTITRYEIQPEPGQRVKSIQTLMDDIALNLAVNGVRFEPSIAGKSAVGIEVPNENRETVTLRSLVESEAFLNEKSKLTACLGADITGKPVVFDVSKMPHLLVAGATGMGKSVCINSIIVSLMYKAKPEELKFILVDPKKVEFAVYRDMPHLLTPIITDPQKAAGALCSAVSEMEERFELIERVGVRDIAGYKKVTAGDPDMPKMPHIVIIIDELADLMMTASNDVDAAIMRIAQKARAAGIHLIIGTQRPSTDVITGTIKANIPSRIACTVASQVDSRTILDAQGAEKLCGRGDMLFAPVGISRPRRVQGSFVSDDEVVRVVNFLINNNGTAVYDEQFMEHINIEAERCANSKKASAEAAQLSECDEDPKFDEAARLAIDSGKLSTSLLQRHLKVGYGRAASIIDHMEELGIVGPADGNKPRKILMTLDEYEAMRAGGEDETN